MPAKFSLLAVVTVPFIPIALACGGDDGGGGIKVVDAGKTVDGAPAVDAPAPCTATPDYGMPSLGSNNQNAKNYPAMGSGSSATPHEIDLTAALNAEQPGDVLLLALFANYGAFKGGDIKTGTFTLMGEDMAFSTCGLCPLIATDVSQSGLTDWYYATAGSVTLTSVTGSLVGSLSNVTLKHVEKDAMGNPGDTVVNDGCTAKITQLNFNTVITMGSATSGDPIAREAAFQRLAISHRTY